MKTTEPICRMSSSTSPRQDPNGEWRVTLSFTVRAPGMKVLLAIANSMEKAVVEATNRILNEKDMAAKILAAAPPSSSTKET